MPTAMNGGNAIRIERIWTIMLATLMVWTWLADHPIQILKMRQIEWVMRGYAIYDVFLVVWFYTTVAVGISLVGRGTGGIADLTRRANN